MSRLASIAVRVESLPDPKPVAVPGSRGLGTLGVDALLAELAGLLERLATDQLAATIDLSSLPMGPQDRIELQAALGPGEVQVTLSAGGISTLHDTSVPGIWWTEHRDAGGNLTAELIDVTCIPSILVNDPAELPAAAAALRALVAARQAGA